MVGNIFIILGFFGYLLVKTEVLEPATHNAKTAKIKRFGRMTLGMKLLGFILYCLGLILSHDVQKLLGIMESSEVAMFMLKKFLDFFHKNRQFLK